MSDLSKLIKESLRKTNAYGLARPVNEKRLYIRVLWVLIWLIVCGLFIWYLVRFIQKYQANNIVTSIKADSIPFEYPDFYFCYNYMMSGTRHELLENGSIQLIISSFEKTDKWCKETGETFCQEMVEVPEKPEVYMNSLPYRFLADNMAHDRDNLTFSPSKIRSSGLASQIDDLIVTEFYHPTHLKCFKVVVNKTNTEKLGFTGRDDTLLFYLPMDAPKETKPSQLPALKVREKNLTAPYWAFDAMNLWYEAIDFKERTIKMYITQPMHYPSELDTVLSLEGGRVYNVQLEMKEKVHDKYTSQCIDKHPDVQMLNPYDHSPYTVKYNYAFCYYSATQAQLKRVLNATCPYLPHPWPPSDHSLYNLSSSWGSAQDVKIYLNGISHLRPEEPLEKCAAMNTCTQRSYTPFVQSVLGSMRNEYLNESQKDIEYERSNFLRLYVSASKPMADQIIFARAYNFESFFADVGGILGICLGMSLLTAFELAQFFHDLAVLLLCSKKNTRQRPR